MPTFTIALRTYLFKHYAIDHTNAMIMIEEEWDYIERCMNEDNSVEYMAKELVDIYMAA